ncbi:MAG TPA: HEPN domain-containing protein [Phycisphaerae bacterium]|nr:HEPN domain-containing protein [Phycisphaerae bacterium]
MRPPEDVRAEALRQWLRRAAEDLAVADQLLDAQTPYLVTVAFHAQQAAEKYLKALLVYHEVAFPRTHDLGILLDLLRPVDGSRADALDDLTALNPYGVEVRYPQDAGDVTEEAAREAREMAARARDAVLGALKGRA